MDKNALCDPRHRLDTSVKIPTGNDVTLYRCEGCLKMYTGWEIKAGGICPTRGCSGRKFRGGTPNTYDLVRFFILNISQNWRVHGPNGWGYERAKKKARGK